MTDEKMAEEKYCKGCKWRMEQCLWAWRNTNGLNEPNEKNCSCKEVPAFLAGLKAGRPQWHDLRKDQNDLPKRDIRFSTHISIPVLTQTSGFAFYQFDDKKWYFQGKEIYVIAWCEIPTFDKE